MPYLLHKDLLRDRSPYFATRLKDCWDGRQDEIELTGVSTWAFEVVIDWMYSGVVPDYVSKESGGRGPLLDVLPELYHAADVLMMTQLQNELVDTYLAHGRQSGGAWTLTGVRSAHVYEIVHTPLYQLVLKSCVRNLMKRLPKVTSSMRRWQRSNSTHKQSLTCCGQSINININNGPTLGKATGVSFTSIRKVRHAAHNEPRLTRESNYPPGVLPLR